MTPPIPIPNGWRTLLLAICLLGLGAPVVAHGATAVRWSESTGRIYVSGPGAVTLTGIQAAVPKAPLDRVQEGIWYLRADLLLENGARLELHGRDAGGDVDELRLQSNNGTNTAHFVMVRADWGSLSLLRTRVTSWNDAAQGPDTEHGTFGRAFISVRSRLAADGVTPLESRMDIIDSEVGYLGHYESEAYGLSWKVSGDQPDLFDRVNVLGDILRSRIHHNYFGIYTYGAEGMRWAGNEVFGCVEYGMDPHDDSDHLVIEDNRVHHNGNHGIIASKRCDHLILRRNESWANDQNGIMLHRACNDALIEENLCYDNLDTGIVVAASARNTIRNNLAFGNAQAGIRLNLGAADNRIEGNTCFSNRWFGIWLFKGSDVPEPGDDGRPKRNQFLGNRISDNAREAIVVADSDDNLFRTNQVTRNGGVIRVERGRRNRLSGNAFDPAPWVKLFGTDTESTILEVTEQSGLRVHVDAYSAAVFEDAAGAVSDPEERDLATRVMPQGSSLTLGFAEIGAASTVALRPLWVRPDSDPLLVDPVLWPSERAADRGWAVWPTRAGQAVEYAVGELVPGHAYLVFRNDDRVGAFLADDLGKLRFSDTLPATNPVTYRLSPTSQISVDREGAELVVRWPRGRLWRATEGVSGPWTEVAGAVSPLRFRPEAEGAIGHFRVVEPGAEAGP